MVNITKVEIHVKVEYPIINLKSKNKINYQLSVPSLIEKAVQNNEGKLTTTGAFCANTGIFTGRSPKDKYIVKTELTKHTIDWGSINQPLSEKAFDEILNEATAYLSNKELYVFNGFAGSDSDYKLSLKVVNELAWHNLFSKQLFIRPSLEELKNFNEDFTIISLPNFKINNKKYNLNSDTLIAINFDKKIVLITGTHYAGEIKKSVFSIMNYLLPEKKVLPMHCSANCNEQEETILYFGLSGTGKTTLSANPEKLLIGDDEHGWSDNGVFNIEGGCYAKCIGLDEEKEPEIWNAIKFGSVLENVILNTDGIADYKDNTLTENTRVAYPIEYIPNHKQNRIASHPKVILFLTADAFGVLPPISKLTKNQAMYHFLSGYTSKLAGTERGITEPQATFSACFGAPFLPRSPEVYANMLGEKIDKHDVKVFLINTGWTGGPYGIGKRMDLQHTRAMVSAAINGLLENVEYQEDSIFNFLIPKSCPGVPNNVLSPRSSWSHSDDYDKKAIFLANLFVDNFKKFDNINEAIKMSSPKLFK